MKHVKIYNGKEFNVVLVNNVRGIVCKKCKNISFNGNDIAYLYCDFCKKTHKHHDSDTKVIGDA